MDKKNKEVVTSTNGVQVKDSDTLGEQVGGYLQHHSLTVFIWVMPVFLAILNLWLASKLAPIEQNIQLLVGKVEALDEGAGDHVSRKEVISRLERIEEQQIRTEEKIDTYILQSRR